MLDTTVQYTVSLGSFSEGGQLCVDATEEEKEEADGSGGGGGGGGGGVGRSDELPHAALPSSSAAKALGLVKVVDTHNRLACVDGRFIHWVRGSGGGDRYSLVFYSLDPDAATKPVCAVPQNWRREDVD
eukprot:SAG22_NODE_2622_length_2365_cov_3.616064_2_plen_129_part_00